MDITRRITVPTGDILIVNGDKGLLECLSLGDYGKERNLKADFLGLERDIEGVPHGAVMPLSTKWVITISTQYGCSMGCRFCDVPKVGPGRNATFDDLIKQVAAAIYIHPEINTTSRLNLHFARMGEPTYNWDVINAATYIAGNMLCRGWPFHPVVSTMMPRHHANLSDYLRAWMHLKNVVMKGNAGLQVSVNTTNEAQRERDFNGSALTLEEISRAINYFEVKGRKIALNFALADDAEIDADRLSTLFNPKKFLCKITPMHVTKSCKENEIKTTGGYTEYTPYKDVEERLKAAGFDVIVFVPSIEEDLGRITCGNAILSGTKPEVEYTDMEITNKDQT